MDEIDAGQALNAHGISTFHNRKPNGELRFRLRKADGAGYIRTEAGPVGTWQESHFHKALAETYIVQKGWIGYAVECDGRAVVTVHGAGQVLTTQPAQIHNIFMPAGSVIHTVKHGQVEGDGRFTCDRCKDFDKITSAISESDLLKRFALPTQIYNEAYRHFDLLIWQVPAWASAIFALSLQALDQSAIAFFTKMTGMESRTVTTGLFFVLALTIGCFSHAMYRFRRHQKAVKAYRPTTIWRSASAYMQLLITAQAFSLAWLALIVSQMVSWVATLLCLAGAIIATAVIERAVHRPRSLPQQL